MTKAKIMFNLQDSTSTSTTSMTRNDDNTDDSDGGDDNNDDDDKSRNNHKFSGLNIDLNNINDSEEDDQHQGPLC